MPTSLLDCIVDLAHYGRLATLDDIRKQLEWAYTEVCGPDILQLIEKSCPVSDKQTRTAKPPPALSPFISTPLRRPLGMINAVNAQHGTPLARLPMSHAAIDGTPMASRLAGQRERKQTQCSMCGAVGHNRKCPSTPLCEMSLTISLISKGKTADVQCTKRRTYR